MRRSLTVGLLLGILSILTLLLLAGHGPWAGHTIWRLDEERGLNSGDVPVLGLWACGSLLCLGLLRRGQA